MSHHEKMYLFDSATCKNSNQSVHLQFWSEFRQFTWTSLGSLAVNKTQVKTDQIAKMYFFFQFEFQMSIIIIIVIHVHVILIKIVYLLEYLCFWWGDSSEFPLRYIMVQKQQKQSELSYHHLSAGVMILFVVIIIIVVVIVSRLFIGRWGDMVFGFLWCVVGSSAPSDSMYLVSITLLQFYANLFETEDNFVMVRR